MKINSNRLLAIVLACALAVALMAKFALAHDGYNHWRAPDNPSVSCCDDSDCRPTRAYLGDDGRWRAWDGQQWLTVPPGKVLPTDLKGDGRSHLREGRLDLLLLADVGEGVTGMTTMAALDGKIVMCSACRQCPAECLVAPARLGGPCLPVCEGCFDGAVDAMLIERERQPSKQ